MEYNGTMICAPQNSGKTSLIVRWAQAANQAGYNVFLVDVKGNLWRKLEGRLQKNIYYFSTDPRETHSDRINFLAGLSGRSAIGTERIQALAEALAQVRRLRGLLPICCSCKRIRDDRGYWEQIEQFVRTRTDASFSHGICPECTTRSSISTADI